MTAKPLTPMQSDVLTYIRECLAEYGQAPTCQEIAGHIGRSKVTAHEHVKALADKGWITVEARKKRAIRVVGRCATCGRES